MSNHNPHSIPNLVRSSSRPRVPLGRVRSFLPFAVFLASAMLLLAVVLFYPQAAQANDPLTFGDKTIANQFYDKDTAVSVTLPEATGGNGNLTYSLSPALPAGLSFDASARTISGTPTERTASAAYRYSATDGTDTAWLSFKIEVAEAQEQQTPVPATPSSVSVSRADGSLTASWPAVEHATSYHITYSSDGKASWSLAALNHPDASITISGVDNSQDLRRGSARPQLQRRQRLAQLPGRRPLHAQNPVLRQYGSRPVLYQRYGH